MIKKELFEVLRQKDISLWDFCENYGLHYGKLLAVQHGILELSDEETAVVKVFLNKAI